MNKEIDALVAKWLDNMPWISEPTRVARLRAALMEARALGLEEAAEACEKLAMNGNEKSIYVGAFEYAIAVRALKGD